MFYICNIMLKSTCLYNDLKFIKQLQMPITLLEKI